MTHPTPSELLGFLEDEPVQEWVEEHIECCAQCQSQLALLTDSEYENYERLTEGVVSKCNSLLFSQNDRYRFRNKLADGGMGTVFRCRDQVLKRDVAVKVISDEFSQLASLELRFAREAKICAKFQHPGIVSIYDFGRLDNGQLFIVMKLIDGKTLHEQLEGLSKPDFDVCPKHKMPKFPEQASCEQFG